MLQQIDILDKEVSRWRKEANAYPSIFSAFDKNVPPEIVQSASIFVAKEKERDAFVTAASKLHRFAETVSALDLQSAPDARALVAQARAVLQVCHSNLIRIVAVLTVCSSLGNWPIHRAAASSGWVGGAHDSRGHDLLH